MKQKNDLHVKVHDYLEDLGIIEGAHILVACSGGPDSTALLHALSRFQASLNLKLTCAYFDHGIRERAETDRDICFLNDFTATLGIPYRVNRFPSGKLKQIASQTKRSLEDVARTIRYRYLTSLAAEISADHIAMGHTLSDQIETLIMRFLKGVSFSGLAGIPTVREQIIRPLLFCTREEVLSYLRENGLKYRTDVTNLSTNFLRNRVRLKLLPVIREVFPAYETTLPLFAEKMRALKDFVEEEAGRRAQWKPVKNKNGTAYRIDGKQFVSLPGIIRLYSLYHTFDRLVSGEIGQKYKKSTQIPYRFLSPVLDEDWFYPKRTLLTGHGIRLCWKGGFLFLEREVVCSYKKGYLISVNEGLRRRIRDTELKIIVGDRNNIQNSEGDLIVDRDSICEPLIVRSRRAGDKISLGLGIKSLKKLFNEWRVPLEMRWSVPIVEDRNEILAVMGKSLGYKNRYSRRVKNLKQTPDRAKACTLIISVVKIG
jgi:tRNA(Ile)-lysidine synthase